MNNKYTCLCGKKVVMACDDGGSNICEQGHVFHTCRVDSIKKYGWCMCYLDKDEDVISCENLPVTFANNTKH